MAKPGTDSWVILRDRSVITKHINNIFKEQELKEELVSANFAHTTRHGAIEGKTQEKTITYFNLDVIISVGYRVNSKRGTQFRQWATQRLKEHLIQGYSVNQQRLQQLQQTIQLLHQTGNTHQLNITEAKGLLDIITHYARSFVLLNQFDSNKLTQKELNKNITYQIEYNDAINAIAELKNELMKKKEASILFGNQKDKSFAGILKSIVQTFDGNYLYPSIEE